MKKRTRTGAISRPLIIGSVILVVFLCGGVYGWKKLSGSSRVETAPQTAKVEKAEFVHEILARGNIESSSNVDITCEVESGGGTTIIKIVEEGTEVKKGDLLVEFDSSSFLETVSKQQISVLNSESTVAQADSDLKNAELELEEYIKGKYPELEKTAENKILSKKEDMRKAEDKLRFNSNLLARGYITESTVEADEFAYRQAENDLVVAELELKNLAEYTKKKNVNTFEAKIKAAKAKLEASQQSLELEEKRLKHLQKQLDMCTVYAPEDGQVVYAPPRWGDESLIIREGLKVYERQQIIKLPDSTKMQVKCLVNEANIRLVKVGDPANIELEAFPNQTFRGVVKTVNDYPEPMGWNSQGMAREYQTTVTILEPPPGVKPGLTAKVNIVVNVIPDALLLPVQSVFEYGIKMYYLTFNAGKWEKHEIKTGPSNGKKVVVESGLSEGDEVVLNAWQNREKLNLPKIDRDKEGENGESKEGKEQDRPAQEQAGQNRPRPERSDQKPQQGRPDGGDQKEKSDSKDAAESKPDAENQENIENKVESNAAAEDKTSSPAASADE